MILEFIKNRKLSLAEPDVYPPQPMHLAVAYILAALVFQVKPRPSACRRHVSRNEVR
jgi:hypothetical protein